jgi:hypothetical protein
VDERSGDILLEFDTLLDPFKRDENIPASDSNRGSENEISTAVAS